MIEGETRFVAQVHGAIAKEIIKTGNPLPLPACILSGGETTVTITGDGLGGRNQEFALSASIDISGKKILLFLAAALMVLMVLQMQPGLFRILLR